VTARAHDTAAGNIFVAPKDGHREAGPGQDGCFIVDNTGQPIWFYPLRDEEADAFNFKVQTYKGESVLSWWEGHHTGYGQGEYVICDRAYEEIARVRAGNGLEGDHHEFLISPQDTALLTIYHKVPMDLSALGGKKDATVLEGIVQEIDIETNEMLFEWRSLEHVGLEESYRKPPQDPSTPLDYFHINSIEIDSDGNFLISAKGTSAVYKVDRESGEILWRLGGRKSDFEMGEGTKTVSQHDARRQEDGTITIFDNGAPPQVHEQSRGIVVDLDMDRMSATLVREYTHPKELIATSQGNVQILPNGNVFVGWGSSPFFSEYAKDGKLLFDATFPAEVESYRAFRFPWSGQPDGAPTLVAERESRGEVTLYASWNGATEVESWEVLAGANPDELEAVAAAPRKGFETAILVETTEAYVGVRAKNGSGKVLGTAVAVKPRD